MIGIGYVILALAALISGVAFAYGRERTIAVALAYFCSYEALGRGLEAVGHYQIIPYMSLAVAIDWLFFYIFLNRNAKIASSACAVSLIYGGLTVILATMGNYLLYWLYEYVAILASVAILFDGAIRAHSYRHNPAGDGRGLHGRSIADHVPGQKKAKN